MDKFWFTISQSAMKDMEKPDTCPYRWKTTWIDGIRREPSVYMNQGSYFETKCLGSGAVSGQDVMDLPRLKNGEKTAAHKRIDEQVLTFKQLITKDLGHEITNTQRVIKTNITLKDGTIVELRGVIDFETEKEGEKWVWDLKLTGDVTTTFGPFPWGDLEEVDFTQQILYRMIDRMSDGAQKRFAMAVFDSSPKKGNLTFEVHPTEWEEDQIINRVEAFVKALRYYKENGFTKWPSKKECANCSFSEKCDKKWIEN